MNLTALDWSIVALPAVVIFVIAIVMQRYLHSVADFLAASRCAGRYLICTAQGEIGAGVAGMVVNLEIFSQSGFSLNLWFGFCGLIYFMLTLLGFVTYRFRETKCLTFHQFFEMRYSRGLRVFASFLTFFSGLFTFGIAPGVAARFFVYFLNFPPSLKLFAWHDSGGLAHPVAIPTFIVIMIGLLGYSLYFALSGGQLSVMVTDCLEGLLSNILNIVVAFTLIAALSYHQMEVAFIQNPTPGKSLVNPFDISGQRDFNGLFVFAGVMMSLYIWRGGAWNAGFTAAGKSAHESKMAGILGVWRSFGGGAMSFLVSAGALTLLRNHEFAVQAQMVKDHLSSLPTEQLRTQMQIPTSLGILLPAGARGAFCAIGLFGTLATFGSTMHGFGSSFVQDVILPFRTESLTPKSHIRLLKSAVVGVAVFALAFSTVYKPPEYLVTAMSVMSALYLAGAGAVVLGGLYWPKATRQGAWAAMIVGAVTSVGFWFIQTFWHELQPMFVAWSGHGWFNQLLAQPGDRCPINGKFLAAISYLLAGVSFVVVSLLTCQVPFELDAMLHRGKYGDHAARQESRPRKRRSIGSLIGIDENYTRGDKVIHYSIFWWSMVTNFVALSILFWNVLYHRWTDHAWFAYHAITGLYITIALGCVTTVWFTWGASRDLVRLLKTLPTLKPDATDDGRVQPNIEGIPPAMLIDGSIEATDRLPALEAGATSA